VQDCGFGLHIQRFFIDDPVGELFGISGYLRAYIEKRQSGFTVNKSFNYYRPVIFLSSLVSIPSSWIFRWCWPPIPVILTPCSVMVQRTRWT